VTTKTPSPEQVEVTRDARVQAFATTIARDFHPERIILFGSHVHGNATPDSDVDLLVIMDRNGKTRQEMAVEIRQKVTAGFPLDMLVRTPEEVRERMGLNDWFMHDVMREGRVLYEK
jgi:predicted nucleotidyltransferase